MILDTGTVVGIVIALAGACFVMVTGMIQYGKLYRENQELGDRLSIWEYRYENQKKT